MDCQSRRRKSSSFTDEEELRKMSRVWIQQDSSALQGMNLPMQPQQQQQQAQEQRVNDASVVPLSLQAAIALQEIRSSIDSANKHGLLQPAAAGASSQGALKFHVHTHQQPQQIQQKQNDQQENQHPQAQQTQAQQQRFHHQQLKALQMHLQQIPGKGNALLEHRYHPLEQELVPKFVPSASMFPPSLAAINPPSTAAASPPPHPPPSSSRLMQKIQVPIQPKLATTTEQFQNTILADLQQQQQQKANPAISSSTARNAWFSSPSSSLDLPRSPLFPSPSSIFSLEFPERAAAVSGGLLQHEHFVTGLSSIPLPKSAAAASYGTQAPSNHNNNNSTSNSTSSSQRPTELAPPQSLDCKDKSKECVKQSDNQQCTSPPPLVVHDQQQRSQPTRTFTKVYKLGSIGRAVDVARFKNYMELRAELSRMFGLEGQLEQKNGWQLVFVDKENDLLLVGDDPWEEFVNSVKGIRILSPSEVSYYTNDERVDLAA